jgi:hypothetical protein
MSDIYQYVQRTERSDRLKFTIVVALITQQFARLLHCYRNVSSASFSLETKINAVASDIRMPCRMVQGQNSDFNPGHTGIESQIIILS